MTREEAIQELQNCIGLIQQDGQDYLDERDIPLLEMAIEALSVANLKEEFESAVPNCQKCAIKELWEATEKEDLVSVVRCKDCRHYGIGNCYMYGGQMNEDDFCSYGERRK